MAVNCLKDLIAKFFWNENDRCRFKLAHIRSYLWEEAFMRSFLMAALAAAGLAMAATSGVYAAPIAPIGKGAQAIDSRADVTYYRYYHRPSSSTSPLLVAPRSSALPLVRRAEELAAPHIGRGAA
jgi:hypothetical protein